MSLTKIDPACSDVSDTAGLDGTVTPLSSIESAAKPLHNSTPREETSNHSTSRQSSGSSQSSSDEYCGVSYEQFEARIRDLCHLLWPSPTTTTRKTSAQRKRKRLIKRMRESTSTFPSYRPKGFLIECMRGGGYNHVFGIQIVGQHDEIEANLVLRVPHMGTPQSDQDVVNLQFVNEYLNLPAPDIVVYDLIDANPLDSPFCIQSRIPGYDLESKDQCWPSLSHKQKLTFVEEYCETLLGLQSIQYPWIGEINKDNNGYTVSPFIAYQENRKMVARRAERRAFSKIRPLGTEQLTCPQDPKDRLRVQSVLHFLETQFGRYRNLEHYAAEEDPSEQWKETIWHRLVRTAKQMWDFGCLESEYNCLTHCDLDPRNIMVEIQPDGNPKITGIIDWNLACFAPEWLSCKPPMWIWNWLDGGSEDETLANDENALNAEQLELKHLFDELVGFVFRFNAYQPHFRLARELFTFARYGLANPDLRAEAEKVCAEWEVMYQGNQAAWEKEQTAAAEECGGENGMGHAENTQLVGEVENAD